jgi:hypothetical protein
MENTMKGPIANNLPATPETITRIPSIPTPPDPAPAAPPAPLSIDETIEIWFAKHFHNLGALMDERVHNILHAAKEDLKAELAKL